MEEKNTKPKQDYFFTLDLVKFICCVVVVTIHSNFYPEIIFPWARIAVPLFFMITAFLFFNKLKDVEEKDKLPLVKKYMIRNLKLYLFYFVLLLPLIIFVMRKDVFMNGFVHFITHFPFTLIFGSTFQGSWFIMACTLGVPLIYWLSTKMKSPMLVIIVSLIYFVVIILSPSYNYLFPNDVVVSFIRQHFISLEFSLFSGLFWITMGKMFAEKELDMHLATSIIILLVGLVSLYFEFKFVTYSHNDDVLSYDVYFSLIPICVSIMGIILKIPNKVKQNNVIKFFRNSTIIIYALHVPIVVGVGYLLGLIHIDFPLLRVGLAIGLLLLISLLFQKLEKIKGFGILKYSH